MNSKRSAPAEPAVSDGNFFGAGWNFVTRWTAFSPAREAERGLNVLIRLALHLRHPATSEAFDPTSRRRTSSPASETARACGFEPVGRSTRAAFHGSAMQKSGARWFGFFAAAVLSACEGSAELVSVDPQEEAPPP